MPSTGLFGVTAAVDGNSWQAALDRLLLGTAVADGSFELAIGGVAVHGVDSGDVEVLGRLAEVVTLLADLSRASRPSRGPRRNGSTSCGRRAAACSTRRPTRLADAGVGIDRRFGP